MNLPQKLLLIALAGGVGTLARYGLSVLIQNAVRPGFPWGTVAVNLLGCLAFGVLWASMERGSAISGEGRAIILIGFMGAFTTFSALILETGELLRAAEWLQAAANVAIQNGIGFAALVMGAALGRMM